MPLAGYQHPDPGCREHGVECRGELGVPVPDQELEAVRVIAGVHQQVAGLLGHPLPRRVSRDPGQVDAAGAALAGAPAQWLQFVRRWTLWNHLRGAGSVAASAAFILAVIRR